MGNAESVTQKINLWVQTLDIVIAGVWAANSFWYKEIKVPSSAPVNVVVTLDLKAPPARGNRVSGSTPVEVTASARNSSTRDVYLLPSTFAAFDAGVTPHNSILQDGVFFGSKSTMAFWDAYATTGTRQLVAVGRLFSNTSLGPGEVISRRFIVFTKSAPHEVFDFQIVIPSVTKKDALDLEWSVARDQTFHQTIYRFGNGNQREDISANGAGEDTKHAAEFEYSQSSTQISLW
jgi:hypothetical protein